MKNTGNVDTELLVWPFLGHQVLGRVITDAVRSDRLGPVTLMIGPAHVGKHAALDWLAAADRCQGQSKPCGACTSCRQAERHEHPDIVTVGSLGQPIVLDDVIVAQSRFHWKSDSKQRTWLIIPDAERMNESAANALLKFLETPPPGLRILMSSSRWTKLPVTIRSRAAIYRWHTVATKEIDQWIRHTTPNMGRTEAAAIARAALGRPGLVQTLQDVAAENPTTQEVFANQERVLRDQLLQSVGVMSRTTNSTHEGQQAHTRDIMSRLHRIWQGYDRIDHNVQPQFVYDDYALV